MDNTFTTLDCGGLCNGILDSAVTSIASLPTMGHKENIIWSNALINAPIVYSLLERRLLYLITLYIKHRFVEKDLGVPDSWKELYFQMTDDDLGVIGGKTRVLQTYEALSKIGQKFVPISFVNNKGEHIVGKVHWIDSFFYNTSTLKYEVRVSPEIMPYLINLSQQFTSFDVSTALLLSSKFGQKFYELCSQFAGDFRFTDTNGNNLKKNVVPLELNKFREIFSLNKIVDPRTNKVISPAKYKNFNDLRKRVLDPAVKELNSLYIEGKSKVWFDYLENKKGRKVVGLYIFIYTNKKPKENGYLPWQEGDEPLEPFEKEYVIPPTPKEKIAQNEWKDASLEHLETIVETLLNRYLKPQETWYYISEIKKNKGYLYNSYLQVIQVIKDKEKQKKFASARAAYKRKSIMQFVLLENLKEYGWYIIPPKQQNKPTSKINEQIGTLKTITNLARKKTV